MKLCPHSLYGYEQNEQQCAHTNLEDVCSELNDTSVLQVEVVLAQQVAVGAISEGGVQAPSLHWPPSFHVYVFLILLISH